ncbi:hypothetical protein [Actinokineospora diospyrosa]|uniref:Uncharacterized protein n=1 Tax=Actinokineospora diospyrosa TaxID=103728 RepID=A0ABT1IKA8_9PSEU|nr:hypothetical protein [Actinokineospora diospyrosa]MCP2273097.1 hypothetical protein [Actinokineospora diospyrosa]
MTDNVRDLLGKAFGDEPPLGIDREVIVADGRRRLRRRRATATGGVAAAVAVVVFGTAVLTNGALGLSQPEVLPAAPLSSDTAPTTPPVSSIAPKAPQTTTTPLPANTYAPRPADLLRTASLPWPAEVSLRPQRPGHQWYEFDDSGEASIVLETPKGPRLLLVRVYFTAAQEHMIECINAQNYKPLPDCTVAVINGAKVRINKDVPPDGPTVVMVTADRLDGSTVEVMETAGLDGLRHQVMPDSTLVRIATLPGLVA